MKYKIAVFDMDGTILNTLDDLHATINHALKTCGYPERTYDEVRRFVGNGLHKLVERAVPQGTSDEEIERVFDELNAYYAVHYQDLTEPYDGIIETIQTIRKAGMKTAVVSNKSDYAVQDLCKVFFDGMFDIALGVQDGLQKKPHPDMVNTALQRLGIDRIDAVYIGDSEVDVATAGNSGLDLLVVGWGFRTAEELAMVGVDRLIATAEELTRELL